MEELKKQVEEKINLIAEQGIQEENLELLGELVDIHKDLSNEDYWKKKEEVMEMNYRGYEESGYGNYGTYGRGRRRDSRGRYMARDGRGRYRGEEMLENMAEHYGNYSEGREMYGADGDTMKSFKYMLKAFKDYYKHLKQEASSQEEVEMLEQTAQEMLEM